MTISLWRMRFGLCPCGFFCKDCLIDEIHDSGVLKGIFWHIMFHTPLGILTIWRFANHLTYVVDEHFFDEEFDAD